ncbi:YbaB/EbfC family nucleoid-associated protein [Eilatimonas milleporae]|uniref:Nucleoid-associated protein BXY39_3101 n=1 Tax=Eilatimonas milleporae TaxID=911205 RepID=A0A3M0C2Z4_9PROT|nr:YbaB/EbfC family nucleoid-associated protein [Eilatimonas milleporae]RMB02750.1 hypothetical protein BXY39_3101 [Eilatimonas milleporae]
MKNLSQMLKKAQEMQAKMGEMQSALDDLTVEGEAGGGLVKIVMSAKGDLKSLHIDDSLMGDDKEILEDLIIAAHAQAKERGQSLVQEKMQDLTGGLPLPEGFKMPF